MEFAIVAEEVRNLAMRSDQAAKNTSEILARSLERVDFGAAKSVQTAGSLKRNVKISEELATQSHVLNDLVAQFKINKGN